MDNENIIRNIMYCETFDDFLIQYPYIEEVINRTNDQELAKRINELYLTWVIANRTWSNKEKWYSDLYQEKTVQTKRI